MRPPPKKAGWPVRPNADDLLAAALDLARRGFKVFRCVPGAKIPVSKGWQEEATSDPDRVASLWLDERGFSRSYNPGVYTADLLVVDGDVKDGLTGLNDMTLLDVPDDTFTVVTPSGGQHRYFRPAQPVRSSVRKIAAGVDVRGAGGFVVGPGAWLDKSIESNRGIGGVYTIARDADVLPAPSELEALCGRPREKANDGEDHGDDDPVDVGRAIAWLDEQPPAIAGEGGDAHTFATIAMLRDFGLSKGMALIALSDWNQTCEPPWTAEELKQKIHNVWRYATNPAGALAMSSALEGVELETIAPPALEGGGWFMYGQPFDPKDYSWLVHEVLPTQGVGLLLGESGSAKTFAALHLAARLSQAEPWHGCDIDDRGATLLFAAEGVYGMRKRLAGLRQHTGEALMSIAGRAVHNLGSDNQVEALKNDVKQRLPALRTHFGAPVKLVVIDTWSAAGLTVDENDNAQIAAALKRLDVMAQDLGVFVLVAHHPKKGSTTDARGGGALRANVDVVLTIEMAESGERKLTLTKSKDAEERVLGGFRLKVVDLGEDAKGRAVTTCVIDECKPPVVMSAPPLGWAAMAGTRGQAYAEDGREVVAFPGSMSTATRMKVTDYGVLTGHFEGIGNDTWVWLK